MTKQEHEPNHEDVIMSVISDVETIAAIADVTSRKYETDTTITILLRNIERLSRSAMEKLTAL